MQNLFEEKLCNHFPYQCALPVKISRSLIITILFKIQIIIDGTIFLIQTLSSMMKKLLPLALLYIALYNNNFIAK